MTTARKRASVSGLYVVATRVGRRLRRDGRFDESWVQSERDQNATRIDARMFGALKNPCEMVDLGGFRRPEADLRLKCFWSVRIAVAFSSEHHQVLPRERGRDRSVLVASARYRLRRRGV